MDEVSTLSGTDGAVEVLAVDGDDIWVGIVNPDGSRAEMSGNGTRIAAAWLMSRTGSADARVHVGPRTVEVRRTEDGLYESELGPVEVGAARGRGRHRADPGLGRQPARGRARRSGADRRARAASRDQPTLSGRTNVQVAHVDAPGEVTARVWERGVGETAASGTSAVAVAAATHISSRRGARFLPIFSGRRPPRAVSKNGRAR